MAIENGDCGGIEILKGTTGVSVMLVMFFCLIVVVVIGVCSLCEDSLSYIIMICTLRCLHVIFKSLLKINESNFFKKFTGKERHIN